MDNISYIDNLYDYMLKMFYDAILLWCCMSSDDEWTLTTIIHLVVIVEFYKR